MQRKVSILVPVYQNEANLPETVPKLLEVGRALPAPLEFELVFVDDGSTDKSYEHLARFQKENPNQIRIVRLTRNFGQNPAMRAGLRMATGDCVCIISADLQEPADALVDMVSRWQKGSKYIIGERTGRNDGFARSITGNLYWSIVRRALRSDFPRLGYDCCLLDRQLVDDLNRIDEINSVLFVLAYWLGYRPERVPIVRQMRLKGRSQWSTMRKIRITLDTLVGFTHLPVRAITYAAVFSSVSSFLYLCYLLVRVAVLGLGPPGWMTITGLLLGFGSVILMALAIICEYLWRILDETRGRPPYVIDTVKGQNL